MISKRVLTTGKPRKGKSAMIAVSATDWAAFNASEMAESTTSALEFVVLGFWAINGEEEIPTHAR